MRRENGAGTVVKIKDRKLRKPYKALVTISYNLNGNPQRKVIGYFGTYKEARLKLDEYAANKGGFNLAKLTFKEIYDRWFEEHSPKVSQSTVKGYNSAYKHLQIFDKKIFSELKLLHWQDLFNNISVKNKSKHVIKSCLKEIYKYAIKYEIVDKCQATFIELGKAEKTTIRSVFTKDEIETLFKMDDMISRSILVLIYTGMRISELLSLTKNNVNDSCVEICKSKTTAGMRIIPISNKIKEIVEGLCDNAEMYLIPSITKTKGHTQMPYGSYRPKFKQLMQKLGMNHTVHDTRHTFVSMLGSAGANDVSLAKLAGHSDVSTSKNIYSHRDIDELKKAIDLLN